MRRLLVLFFIVGVGGFIFFKVKKKKKILVPEKVVVAKYMDLNDTLDETGIIKVQDKNFVSINSPINEKIVRVYIKKGDYVSKNEVLATLDTYYINKDIKEIKNKLQKLIFEHKKEIKDYNKQLTDLSYELQNLKTNLEKTKKDFKYYAWLVSKYSYLYRHGKLISEEKYKNAKLTLDKLKDEINSIKENIKKVKADIEIINEKLKFSNKIFEKERRDLLLDLKEKYRKLKDYNITAPISGQVVTINAKEGTYPVNPLFEILNPKNFINYVYVDETDIGKIKHGQKVIFYVDAYPNRKYYGKIQEIIKKPSIQNNVVFYLVKVSGFNETGLLPEMTSHNTIIIKTLKHVLAIPFSAVKWENGKEIVYVLKGNKIEKRVVTTGVESNGYIQIIRGLKPGEKVVISFKE